MNCQKKTRTWSRPPIQIEWKSFARCAECTLTLLFVFCFSLFSFLSISLIFDWLHICAFPWANTWPWFLWIRSPCLMSFFHFQFQLSFQDTYSADNNFLQRLGDNRHKLRNILNKFWHIIYSVNNFLSTFINFYDCNNNRILS